MRLALVTGATGFIGSSLVKRLHRDGHAVRALVLNADTPDPDWDAGVEVIRGDVTSSQQLACALAGVDTVFHLAAVVGDWGAEDLFQRVTVEGTRNVLAAAAAVRARVVLASSIVVYGDRLGRETCVEQTPHGRAYGPYSRAKQAQEVLAREWLQRGADIRVVRPANVYGPGSRIWVDEVVRLLLRGAPVLVSGGDRDAGLVHVDNVVDILLRAASDRAASGGIYNACDELGVSWRRYFGDLAAMAGAPSPRSAPSWMVWPMATVMERLWRTAGASQRPPLTREAVHLISADIKVPATQARQDLGHRSLVDYPAGMAAISAYAIQTGLIQSPPSRQSG